MDPSKIELNSISKLFEYEKISREIENCEDIEVLKNPTSKFLDPCAGIGTFGVVIYNELLKGQETFDIIYNDVCSIINNHNIYNTISLIRKPSEETFLHFEHESIDVLHIDGNHNELNVSRDILLYLHLVKKGGYIIMDDSNWGSVRNAINNFLIPHCDLIQDFGIFSCYKKK